MELTIDTSTNLAGVALSDRGHIIAESTWHSKQNHTVELIPAMISLLQIQRKQIRDVNAVIVAKGPGSFNGLRVGLATAKGLAASLEIPLVGISTLEAAAFAHVDLGLAVCPIVPAGRIAIATGLFKNRGGKWDRVVDEHITTMDQWVPQIKDEAVFCGEINDELVGHLKVRLGDRAVFPEESPMAVRVRSLFFLGWRRIGSGDLDDVRTLQPMYLKRPAITVPRKRRHDAMSSMRARSQ